MVLAIQKNSSSVSKHDQKILALKFNASYTSFIPTIAKAMSDLKTNGLSTPSLAHKYYLYLNARSDPNTDIDNDAYEFWWDCLFPYLQDLAPKGYTLDADGAVLVYKEIK